MTSVRRSNYNFNDDFSSTAMYENLIFAYGVITAIDLQRINWILKGIKCTPAADMVVPTYSTNVAFRRGVENRDKLPVAQTHLSWSIWKNYNRL